MAVQRDNPYGSFNFLVDLGTGDTESVLAGFQEVSGLNMEVTIQEYRNGNDKTNRVRKVSGMYKVGDITLKRGLIGALDLYTWIVDVRNGNQGAARNITITQQDEARNGPIVTWRLVNARPSKYTGPSLNAKSSSDVAIEELVLSCEDLFVE
jgi:phage tail-like protein